MKPFSPSLELAVLKTLTESQSKVQSLILNGIGTECFHTEAGSIIYSRVKTVIKKSGDVPSWGDIKTDPVIPENIRQRVSSLRIELIEASDVKRNLKRLHEFRRVRNLYKMTAKLSEALRHDSVDIDDLERRVGDVLVSNQIKQTPEGWFTHMGMPNDDSSMRVLKRTLNMPSDFYIPTGFSGFDSVNRGIPRGSMVIVAAPTGAGKSLFAHQLAENMASWGAKCVMVPLEMSIEEMYQRHISRHNRISMSRMLDPKSLSREDREKIVSNHRRFLDKLRNKRALLSFLSPQEDLTFEETLSIIKPYDYDVKIIDYVGLLAGLDNDQQWRVMRNITRQGKRHATITKSILILCAQLAKDGEALRYSQGMEEDASLLFKWKLDELAKETGVAFVDLTKGRNQKKPTFPIKFDWDVMTVKDVTSDDIKKYQQRVEDAEKDKPRKSEKREISAPPRSHKKANSSDGYFKLE